MKISSNNLDVSPVAATRDVDASVKTSGAPEARVSKDAVALSANAAGLSSVSLKGESRGASEARMKELTDAVSSGSYKIDHQALAERILDADGGT